MDELSELDLGQDEGAWGEVSTSEPPAPPVTELEPPPEKDPEGTTRSPFMLDFYSRSESPDSQLEGEAAEAREEPAKPTPEPEQRSEFKLQPEKDSNAQSQNGDAAELDLLEEPSPTKRSLRSKPRKKVYEDLDSDPEMMPDEDEDSLFPRINKRYYSDDDYIPGSERKKSKYRKSDLSEDEEEEEEEEEIVEESPKKKRKRKKAGEQKTPMKKPATSKKSRSSTGKRGKKMGPNEQTDPDVADDNVKTESENQDGSSKVNVTTEPVTLDSDSDIENCLQSSRIKLDEDTKKKLFTSDSNDSSLNGTLESKKIPVKNGPTSEMGQAFENFLANKDLKIKKLNKKSKESKTKLEIPTVNPPEVVPPVDNSTQTDTVVTKSIEMQTSSPYAIKMKECLVLSTEQSENACEFMRGVLKTTSELGKLMCEKSEEFVEKKINTVHVKDTTKMDYCIKKAFLLFKLAKDNLSTMEETLEKQYEEFLRTNELISAIETEKKMTPKDPEEGNDSDCEIVGETTVKQEPTKEKINPKTVFLNKELSIKMAKKPATSNPAPADGQKVKLGGRHAVWINKSIMVKKVKPTQSFLAQDSRLKKPPDNFITEEAVRHFFDSYYKVNKCCEPFTSLQWLNFERYEITCNYFVAEKPAQDSNNGDQRESSSEDDGFFEGPTSKDNLTEINNEYDVVGPSNLKTIEQEPQRSTINEPMSLFTQCIQYLQKLFYHSKTNNKFKAAPIEEYTNTDYIHILNPKKIPLPKSLFSMCVKHLEKKTKQLAPARSTFAQFSICKPLISNGFSEETETLNNIILNSDPLPKTYKSPQTLSRISLEICNKIYKIQSYSNRNNNEVISSIKKPKVLHLKTENRPASLQTICYKKIIFLLYNQQTRTSVECASIIPEHNLSLDELSFSPQLEETRKEIITPITCFDIDISEHKTKTLNEICLININKYMGTTEKCNQTETFSNFSESEEDLLAEECEFPDNDEFDPASVLQNNWAANIELKELKSGVSNIFDKQDGQFTNEEHLLKGITLKLEPLDNDLDGIVPGVQIKTENEEFRNEMVNIPNFGIVAKTELLRTYENEFGNDVIPDSTAIELQSSTVVDGESFEEFVRRNKLMHGHIEYASPSSPNDALTQKKGKVRREFEPDSDTENDPMSLLIPQSFRSIAIQPAKKAKGTLLESSSEDEGKKKTSEKKKRGRPRKNKKAETQPNTPQKDIQTTTNLVTKEKSTNEIEILTRRMRDRIRNDERQKQSSSDSEAEILYSLNTKDTPVTEEKAPEKQKESSKISSDSETEILYSFNTMNTVTTDETVTKELTGKKSLRRKLKDDLPQDKNAHISRSLRSNKKEGENIHDNQKKETSPIFTGFTTEDINEMDYVNSISTKIESLSDDISRTYSLEKQTKHTAIEKTGDGNDNLEDRDDMNSDFGNDDNSMAIFEPVVDIHENVDNVATAELEKDMFIQDNRPKENQCVVDLLSDPKLYQLCYVPMDKLPDSFVETYFQFMKLGGSRNDSEIDRLTNIKSLHRPTISKEEGKERKRAPKDATKLQGANDTSRVPSPDNRDELEPSDDDVDRTEAPTSVDPTQVEIKTENTLAKNSLMGEAGSDSDSQNEDIPLADRKSKEKSPKGPKSKKKLVDVAPDPSSLVLTADKMMKKELQMLHAPVIIDENEAGTSKPLGKTPQKTSRPGTSRRHRRKSGDESDGSSEEEKQWITTKEKLLKRLEKKRNEELKIDDAKRTRIVNEYIEKKSEECEGDTYSATLLQRRRNRRGVKKKRMSRKQKERELRMLSLELKKELLNGQLVDDANNFQPIHGKKGSVNTFRGRRNIRKVIDKKSLARSTVLANMEEFERKRRLAMQQAQLSEFLGYDDSVKVLVINNEVCLEYNFQACQPVVSVHSAFTNVMKAHQCEGVKFMWDASFESLDRISSGHPGGGCILAHCMGLGKTLQVLALLHTVMTHPKVGVRRVLVCCPLSTVLNWVDEIHKWLGPVNNTIKVFELSKLKKTYERAYQLEDWYNGGGIFIIGYELFRSLTTLDPYLDDIRPTIVNKIKSALLDPGPDIVICDEGHLLKNDCSVLAVAMSRVQTRRRIVLTGTPMQNNLREYYCMVNFVKPNLLGTYSEYSNRFENPIMNGQHRDSSDADIRLMKARTHILHKVLEGCLQRQEASVLYPYLPKKYEYTVFISLTKCQSDLYKHYLEKLAKQTKASNSILKDFHILQKVWTHPQALHNFQMKARDYAAKEIKEEVKMEDDLRKEDLMESAEIKNVTTDVWWTQYLDDGQMLNMLGSSNKFTVVFEILNECVRVNDKLLIFSTSLFTMDSLEYFLKHIRQWSLGREYYRLDGSVPPEVRQKWCREFNAENNKNTKLFLISTRAGCLGLNMTAANRVIILDTSWNPAHDIQSIFRVYRFGQRKDCHIYRLVSMGTMEQKIYERSVTKQAVACRVVDEQQIDRHYNMAELTELYSFDESGGTLSRGVAPGVADPVLLGVARSQPAVWAVHEHDSLLRDSCEQQLPEHERAEAWDQFQREQAHSDPVKDTKRKKKITQPPPPLPPPPIPTVPSVTITKNAQGWTARRISTSSTDSVHDGPGDDQQLDPDSDDQPLEPKQETVPRKVEEPEPSTSKTQSIKGKKLANKKKKSQSKTIVIPIQPEKPSQTESIYKPTPIQPICSSQSKAMQLIARTEPPNQQSTSDTIILSDDEPEAPAVLLKPTLRVLSKQNLNSKVQPATDTETPKKVPLHPSLLTNPYFLKIVAHTYRSWNPNLQDDAALSAAQFSANLLLKKGGDILSGTLYEIAAKTLTIPTMTALWQNFESDKKKKGSIGILPDEVFGPQARQMPQNKLASEKTPGLQKAPEPQPALIPHLKPGPRSKKALTPHKQPTLPSTPSVVPQPKPVTLHLGPSTDTNNSNIVPIGLIRSTVDLSNEGEEESILPDDDVPRIGTASPPPLSASAPTPELVDMAPPALSLLEESPVQPTRGRQKQTVINNISNRRLRQKLSPERNQFDITTRVVARDSIASRKEKPPTRVTIIRKQGKKLVTAEPAEPAPTQLLNSANHVIPKTPPSTLVPSVMSTVHDTSESICLDSDDEEVLPKARQEKPSAPTIVGMIGPNGQPMNPPFLGQHQHVTNIPSTGQASNAVPSRLRGNQNSQNQTQPTIVNMIGPNGQVMNPPGQQIGGNTQPFISNVARQQPNMKIFNSNFQNPTGPTIAGMVGPTSEQTQTNAQNEDQDQAQTLLGSIQQVISQPQGQSQQSQAQEILEKIQFLINQNQTITQIKNPPQPQQTNKPNLVAGQNIFISQSQTNFSQTQPIILQAQSNIRQPQPITLQMQANAGQQLQFGQNQQVIMQGQQIDIAALQAIISKNQGLNLNQIPELKSILNQSNQVGNIILVPASALKTGLPQQKDFPVPPLHQRKRGRPRKDDYQANTENVPAPDPPLTTETSPKNTNTSNSNPLETAVEPTSVEEISSSVDLTEKRPMRKRLRISTSSSSSSSSSASSRDSSPEAVEDIFKNVVQIPAKLYEASKAKSSNKIIYPSKPPDEHVGKKSTTPNIIKKAMAEKAKISITKSTNNKIIVTKKIESDTVDLTDIPSIDIQTRGVLQKAQSVLTKAKNSPFASKATPAMSKTVSSASKTALNTSKPVPSTSKQPPSTSKQPPSTSKPPLSTSKPPPSTSKPPPSTSKQLPTTSKQLPTTSKSVIATSKGNSSAKRTGPERILGTVDLTEEPLTKRTIPKPSEPLKTPTVVTDKGLSSKTIFINSTGVVSQGAKNIMIGKSGAVSLSKPSTSSNAESPDKPKVVNITSITTDLTSVDTVKRKAPPAAVVPLKKIKSEKPKPMSLEDFTIDDMLDDIVELE